MLENGANLNAKTGDGSTPLDRAFMEKHSHVVEFLKQHGAEE